MAKIIMSKKRSDRGKEIEEHLRLVSMEPWFLKTRRTGKDEASEIDICTYCDQQLERPYWEPRYKGIKINAEIVM